MLLVDQLKASLREAGFKFKVVGASIRVPLKGRVFHLDPFVNTVEVGEVKGGLIRGGKCMSVDDVIHFLQAL